MKITLIDYNAGNVRSVLFALKRLGKKAELTSDLKKIGMSDKVIFPGVGEARSTMRFLRAKGLDKLIPQLKQPLLGICLGLQLLCADSEENNTECLGIFRQKVKKFEVQQEGEKLKVPHIGWNDIFGLEGSLFKEVPEKSQVYFVHSYYADLGEETCAKCHYGIDFSAALQKNNFYALQFHPEKSADVGELILKNFLEI